MTETMTDAMTVWRQSRYGGPEVVQRTTCPRPVPGTGQVLVRVDASSLNSADVHIMRGMPLLVRTGFGWRTPRTPVPGRDVAGTVVEVGDGVTELRPGDRVAGELRQAGGLGEFTLARAVEVTRIPAGVDPATAAALPLAGGSAWQALERGGVTAGSRVLVVGAGGGVGTHLVRLAVLRGADVHALCSPRAADAVAGLGATRVDPRDTPLSTLPAGAYDAVFDLGGRVRLRALRRLARDGGSVVMVAAGENPVGPIGRMLRAAILSIRSRRPIRVLMASADPAITASLLDLAAAGTLRPVIDSTYTLSDAGAALARVDAGGLVGKVLVVPDAAGD
jgi:NADPH:quinone reductase-like Zn-dependent oxidoreductase